MTPTRPARCALVLATALLVGGCAGGGGSETGGTSTSPAAPTPTDPPGTSPDGTPGAGSRGIPTSATVEVLAISDGCVYVVASGSGETWALRGDVPAVAVGDRFALTGAADDTPFPECPDGAPFLVGEVSPAG
jgi:hypothetical protein